MGLAEFMRASQSRSAVLGAYSMAIIFVLTSAYAAVGVAALALLMVYRGGTPQSITGSLLATRSGQLGIGLVLAAILLAVLVVVLFRRQDAAKRRHLLQLLVLNAVMAVGVMGILEVAVRLLVVETPGATFIGSRLFAPRIWDRVAARFSTVLQEAERVDPYQVPSDGLGWTVGKSRTSRNGMYLSSEEGLRSAAVGTRYVDRTAQYRVALLGDSFVFGEEVPFSDSMGAALQTRLGDTTQVLNFGVPGYGVDQMALRYEQEVRRWKVPIEIVVLGFIEDDMSRSMMVYPFIGRPHWLTPWSKPRFVLDGPALALHNHPTLAADRIFAAPSIKTLPFIDEDIAYCTAEWDRPGWGLLNRVYLWRLAISLLPQYCEERTEISDETRQAIHQRLFQRFYERVIADDAHPIIALLPNPESYDVAGARLKDGEAQRVLKQAGVPFVDLTDCLGAVPSAERFVRPASGHYSKRGNEAVAACLHSEIKPVLEHLAGGAGGS